MRPERACVDRIQLLRLSEAAAGVAFAPAHAAKHLPFTVSTLVVQNALHGVLQILPFLLHKLRQKRAVFHLRAEKQF